MYALLSMVLSLPFVAAACSSSMSEEHEARKLSAMNNFAFRTSFASQNRVNPFEGAKPSSYMYGEISCFSPQSSLSTSRSSTLLNVEINNGNQCLTNAHAACYAYLFPEVLALYKDGALEELTKQANAIGIGSCLSSSLLRKKKNYINSLLKDGNKAQLQRLARLVVINTPRRMRVQLDKIFQETKDPLQRFHALRLADKQTGGGNFIANTDLPTKHHIPSDGNPGEFVGRDFLAEIRQETPYAEELIGMEMAKYAADRYLAEIGNNPTRQQTDYYVKQLLDISSQVPFEEKKNLLYYGISEYLTKACDIRGNVACHGQALLKMSQELSLATEKVCLGQFNYFPKRTAEIVEAIEDIIENSTPEELTRIVAHRLVDCTYGLAYAAGTYGVYHGIEYALGHKTYEYMSHQIVSRFLHKSEITGVTGSVINSQRVLSDKQVLDLYTKSNLTEVVVRCMDEGKRLITGKLPDGCMLILRDECSSYGKGVTTVEYQMSPAVSLKIRFASSVEVFKAMKGK